MVSCGSARIRHATRAKNSQYIGECLRCTDVSCMTASDYGTMYGERQKKC